MFVVGIRGRSGKDMYGFENLSYGGRGLTVPPIFALQPLTRRLPCIVLLLGIVPC